MREIRKTIAAGGEEFVDAAGDFIFCSFADRNVLITIDGQPVTVRAGDKVRPQKRIKDFLIKNPDPVNEVAITLVVGEGDYNSQLIQGEVSVLPGVRGADGQWKDDTRHNITLDLYPARAFSKTYPVDEPIRALAPLTYDQDDVLGATREGPITFIPGPSGMYQIISKSVFNGVSWIGGAAYRLYSLGGSLIEKSDQVNGLRGVSLAAFYGGVFYQVNGVLGPGTDKVVKGWDATSNDVVYSAPGGASIAFIAGWSDGLIVCDSNRVWAKIDGDGNVSTLERPAFDGDAGTNGDLRWSEALGYGFYVNNLNWQMVDSGLNALGASFPVDSGASPHQEGFFIVSSRFYVSSDNSGLPELYPFKQVVEPGSFTATSVGCVDGLLKKGNPWFITGADIQLSAAAGNVSIRGEVIRAALEQFFGREIGEGYMDHVYRFATDSSQYGGLATVIEGGTRSLQARGQADDLLVLIPARVSITIDDDLPLI